MKYIENNVDFENSLKTEVVVVDFYADWCGPCRMLAPIIENMSHDFSANKRVLVTKLDVDKVGSVASKFNVSSIPTVIFFKNGVEAGRVIGYKPMQYFTEVVNKLLK